MTDDHSYDVLDVVDHCWARVHIESCDCYKLLFSLYIMLMC